MQYTILRALRASCFAVLLAVIASAAHGVTIDWVTVGDPGNACEVQPPRASIPGGCFGAVAYEYQIGKYEVTNTQYAEFLNTVAATDTYTLYNTEMGSGNGGITRSGISGSYTYSTIAGRENMPVAYTSFYDSLRFANWLHNGQGSGDTETGAYTMITESYPDGPFITRNADATIFLPTEDEWYKAAYYDAVSTTYFDYPAGTDTQTVCTTPGATANTANCTLSVADLTDVGSYTGSASPYGTFDQGGNLPERNEAIIGSKRGVRGGSWHADFPGSLAASGRYYMDPALESRFVSFRVAMIPEPTTALLLTIGLAGLAVAGRRRALR